jgi:predicted nuclease of restriction endonuclease-like (RecB) superfamily
MKEFFIKEFLDSYSFVLSNQQITNIKRYFIQLMEIFEEHQLIESSYQVIVNDKVYHVDKLLPNNISEGFIIFEGLSF